ncbi:MAG TPA: hypothetical protein VLJ68_13440 [Chitinophagaceae bacterium]|nr:hypothetical protein [Chitinophagaceae bacterium]
MKYTIVSILLLLLYPGKSSAHEALITNSGDTLVYGLWDPPYQTRRNYTIKVMPNRVYFFVETWSKVLLKKSFPLKKSEYRSFLKSLDSLHIKNIPVRGDPCIGSGSETLLLYPGTPAQVKGYVSYCGNDVHGTLDGDVQAASRLFKALVPKLEETLEALDKDDQ